MSWYWWYSCVVHTRSLKTVNWRCIDANFDSCQPSLRSCPLSDHDLIKATIWVLRHQAHLSVYSNLYLVSTGGCACWVHHSPSTTMVTMPIIKVLYTYSGGDNFVWTKPSIKQTRFQSCIPYVRSFVVILFIFVFDLFFVLCFEERHIFLTFSQIYLKKSYLTIVDHSVFNTVLPWCPGWDVQSQVLPWSELTLRSLSSTAPALQVRCSDGASRNGNNFLNWTGDPLQQSQRPFNHCV